jgi:hypothetical protein
MFEEWTNDQLEILNFHGGVLCRNLSNFVAFDIDLIGNDIQLDTPRDEAQNRQYQAPHSLSIILICE